MNRNILKRGIRPLLLAAAAAVLIAFACVPTADASGQRTQVQPCPIQPCPVPACPVTAFETGPDSDDLKVRIIGTAFDTIEVYFKTEYFYRETFANTSYLQFGDRVALARKNKFGTFAVRIGDGSVVRAYGWKSSKEKPESIDLPVDGKCGVRMEWVTDRILKVSHGPDLARETVVRFNDADKVWTEMFKN